RRHTRWPRDWSSDVCSSDLDARPGEVRKERRLCRTWHGSLVSPVTVLYSRPFALFAGFLIGVDRRFQYRRQEVGMSIVRLAMIRSEERRVGKECRCWWWASS